MAPKRRKRSGLTGVELIAAVTSLNALADKMRKGPPLHEEDAEDADDAEELRELEALLKKLQSKVDAPRRYSFSSMTLDHLEKMNISRSGLLALKSDAITRAVDADSVGADELWSADTLYRHLCVLEDLVPRNNEAAARLWINAFLYRVAAMTPNMVLSVEQPALSVPLSDQSFDTLSGYVDWTAIVMSNKTSGKEFLIDPSLPHLKKEDCALFISEAKGPDQILTNHVPQAVCGMYACAKIAGKTVIRGALTNGIHWIFLILTLNDNGGGNYRQSNELSYHTGIDRTETSRQYVSVVSAIIAYWTEHSHEALNVHEDYFVRLA